MSQTTQVVADREIRPSGTRGEAGSSLVEALVTMVLIAFLMLSIAQLIGTSVLVHKASEDITAATAIAEHKLEELRNVDYDALVAGGSLVADVGGFSETEDVDADGTVDFRCRWRVVDNGVSKNIGVVVRAVRAVTGPTKGASLFARVANP